MSRNVWGLLFAPVLAWANGETLYVDTTAAAGGNGSVSTPWNDWSFSTSSRVATTDTAGKVDPGDTLIVSGSLSGQQNWGDTGGAYLGSGTKALPITLDLRNLTINAASGNYGLYSEQRYLNILPGTFTGGSINGGYIYIVKNGGGYEDKSITITGGTFNDCTDATVEACIQVNGDNFVIDSPTCDGADGYCVLMAGANNWAKKGVATDNGSVCVIADNSVAGAKITDWRCTPRTGTGDRYCYQLYDVAGTTVPGLVAANRCDFSNGVTSGASTGVVTNTASTIAGNTVIASKNGIVVEAGATSELVEVVGNKVKVHTTRGIQITSGATNVKAYNNSLIGNGSSVGIITFQDQALHDLKNNILYDNSIGIDEQAATSSSTTDAYNSFFSNTTNHRVNFGSTSLGTGSITDDPVLDANYDIISGSPAWSTGVGVYPHWGESGKCIGSVVNIGATCATPVPYGYTLKPKKRR